MTERNGEARELPKGWALVDFQDIVESFKRGPFGSAIKKEFFVLDGFKVYEQQNAIYDDPKRGDYFIDQDKYDELEGFQIKPKDFIVSCSGTIGKISRLPDNAKPGVINQALLRIRLNESIYYPKLFLFLFRAAFFQKLVQVETRGSAMKNIAGVKDLKVIPVNLPPCAEQERIVEKIEELFSELDQGIENLKTAQKQLKVYRQAVLKWAFEGKLTEQWRQQAQQQGTLKTGEELLAQIKAERENRYQQQVADWEAAVKTWEVNGKPGKKPSKPSKPKDLPPLTPTELAELPPLPHGWCWTKLGCISEEIFDGPFGSNLKTEDYTDSGVRVIRLENIEYLAFNNDKKTYISEEKYKTLEKHTVYEGDVIFSSFINEKIRAIVLPKLDEKAIAKADCFCIRNRNELINQKWLVYILSTKHSYDRLVVETHGFTRPRINTTQIKNLVVPVCSIAEQEQVVQEVESRFSNCDQLEQTIAENLQKAEALRQSILKQAFEGKLVPQDPNDEPAEKLLERIRAETENKLRDVQLLKRR